jgi:hypothetical protein
MDKGAWDLQMTLLKDKAGEANFRDAIQKSCASWTDSLPERETPEIRQGTLVRLPTGTTAKDDPSLLTMMFGSMGSLMTEVDIAARSFRQACPLDRSRKPASDYLVRIDRLLASGRVQAGEDAPQLGIERRTDLPRMLLRGETGVGKTLIAGYLHRNCGFQGSPLRIPIPEYLGKEDMFEYDFFGYMQGAYTDAKEGKHGLLLEHVGGVVFLDEIGEANDILQAKLLAFLDDYHVRPRKWEGTPFYCPVLVVAATNRDLKQMAKAGKFRRDLLARFTSRHKIPALKDRTDEMPFILDCLLQRTSINPNRLVTEIGREAFQSLTSFGFEEGNFRQLEDVLRSACHCAVRDGRDYLAKRDFQLKP